MFVLNFQKKPVACNLEELEEYRKKKIEYDKVVYLKGEEKEKLKKEHVYTEPILQSTISL